jgi:nucleotide-binding universal stress UspA family protein
MPGPIIVAHEPACDDRAPVEFALAVARDCDARVIAVSVLDATRVAGRSADPEVRPAVDASHARLRHDLDVETEVVVDMSVPHAIHRIAEHERAELLVVGRTDRGALGRVLPASTAERLIHGAHCAVALVPSGWTEQPIESIAVAFVDTPEGRAALRTAHRIALGTAAELRVATVVHPLTRVDNAAAEARTAAVNALRALGPEGEIEVHVDDPADLLVDISEHVDLLVCGSRAYPPLRAVLLGSVSRRVVDRARCPVLVVPRGVEQPLAGLLPLRTAERT